MKRSLRVAALATCLALHAAGAQASPTGQAQAWGPAVLAHSEQSEMQSRHTGRGYRIYVSAPSVEPPPGGFPVLYVLDGNAMFPLLALQARALESRDPSRGLEPVVVVGIGYPTGEMFDAQARAEDYTPPAEDLSDTGDVRARTQGGAARFLAFIEGELKPVIEARYPVNRQRQTLFGHSYGGLFTLYTLFHQPQSFQTYIAASPSLWWNKRHLLQPAQQSAFAERLRREPVRARLHLSMGGAEQPPPGAPQDTVRQRRIAGWRMVDNVRELAAALAPLQSHGLISELNILPGETHGSNALLTSIRALDYALADRGSAAVAE